MARSEIEAQRIEEPPVGRPLGGKRAMERPDADLESRRQAASRDTPLLQLLSEGGARTVGEGCRSRFTEPVRRVSIEQ